MIWNKKTLRKMWAVLLSVAMTITMLPQISMTAHAAQGDPAMSPGAAILKAKVNTIDAQTVHMADKTWRVIGYGGEGVASSADTLALISSGNIKTKVQFRSDYGASDANHYSKSNLKTEVDAVANTFTEKEKAGIAARTLASGTFRYTEQADCVAGDPVENALLWPLSTKEANAMSNSLRMVDHLHQMDPINTWWLRSPGNQISWAAFVIGSGEVNRLGTRVSNEYGVRPAFNYNLESIVLTTAATGGKASGAVGADALNQVGTNTEGDWKLTVADDAHKNFAVTNVSETDNGAKVTYTGARAGVNEYISAIVTDKKITAEGAKIKYYGRIKNSANAGDATGTLTINTEGKLGKNDVLYVFSEQCNGDKKTDYASPLQEVTIPHELHDLAKTNRVDPTCTKQGTEEYWTCKICEKIFSDEEATNEITKPATIPATGHKWNEPSYTWADDNSEVTAKHKCETCGTEEIETVKTSSTVVKEANCKEKGEKKYTAAFENEAFKEQTRTVELPVQPNNHVWDEGKEVQGQDICGGKGMLHTCKLCGKTKVEGTGQHTWETEYTIFTEPTCTEKGEEFYKCSKCDAMDLERPHVIPSLGHKWSEPSYTWSDDYSEVTAKRKCENCGTEEKETVKTKTTVIKEANCKEKGENKYTATFENKAFEEQSKTVEMPVQPNNHAWDEGKEIEGQNICGGKGMLYTCSICGKTRVEGIGDHDWSTEWTYFPEPTCTEGGNRFHKCKNCDAFNLEDFEYLDPLGHDWSTPTYKWAADNSSVTAERACGHDASHAETETVGTVKTTKDATCTEKGETKYTATFKNGSFDEQTKTEEIAATGHKWDAGKVTKKATETSAGVMTYTCTVCGKTKTKAIPKLKTVLAAKGIAKGKKAVNLSWNKVKGADRYVIYMSKCNHKGKKYTMKKVKTVKAKTLKWTKKGLKKKTAYKFYVKAQKKSGKKYKTIAKSRVGHFFTGNVKGKYTNPKSLKLKKSKITLKKGKSATIKGAVAKVKKSKKLATNHAAKLRFTSNNPSVAKVNSKGKVTAKAKGTATIYIQTINGIWKTCKVTIK